MRTIPAISGTDTQKPRTVQDSHLDHPSDLHPPHELPRPQHESDRPPLRRLYWLSLGPELHQVPRTAREDPPLDREQAQPVGETTALRLRRPLHLRPLRRFALDHSLGHVAYGRRRLQPTTRPVIGKYSLLYCVYTRRWMTGAAWSVRFRRGNEKGFAFTRLKIRQHEETHGNITLRLLEFWLSCT